MKDCIKIKLTFPRSGQEIVVMVPRMLVEKAFGDHLLAA
jgi:hypothetical protein